MIELSRALVRQFRAVVRKSVMAADPRGPSPVVVCRAGRQGLALSCRQGGVGVRHHTPGSFPNASVAIPFAKLADLESAGEVITLKQLAPFKASATWHAGGEPQALEFDTADPSSLPPAPQPARNCASLEADFLTALDDAARTASREAVRFATHRVLLRGRDGAVVATDGRQLLLRRGFDFPWKGDHFLPALPVFGGRELPRDQPVKLGLGKENITLEVGPWLFAFRVEQGTKFPEVDKVIPDAGGSITRLQLDASDIAELVERLPRLPGHEEQYQEVTLDLGRPIAVRGRSRNGEVSEVVLSHARREGPSLLAVMDRRYLLRALKLGFTEILIASANQPVLCKDSKRTYLWMPLGEADAVPAPPAPRHEPARGTVPTPAIHTEPTRSSPIMPPATPPNEPPRNGQHRNGGAEPGEPLDPIAEAEELRVALQAALTRTSRLIAALKQQRRQSRVVESALASLRRLQ